MRPDSESGEDLHWGRGVKSSCRMARAPVKNYKTRPTSVLQIEVSAPGWGPSNSLKMTYDTQSVQLFVRKAPQTIKSIKCLFPACSCSHLMTEF